MDDNTPTQTPAQDDDGQMLPSLHADDAQPTDFDGHVPAGQTMPDSHALVPVPDEAADTDLIEKEWVLKAKQIVDHTAEDPFAQAEEIGKMRDDYMKKRYNRDVGVV